MRKGWTRQLVADKARTSSFLTEKVANQKRTYILTVGSEFDARGTKPQIPPRALHIHAPSDSRISASNE